MEADDGYVTANSDVSCYCYDYDEGDSGGDGDGSEVENDYDDFAEDRGSAARAGPKTKLQIITKASLLAAQKEDLQRVMDLLSVREHQARTLLIHFRWDVDKLITVFVERGEDQLYSLAGIVRSKDSQLSVPALSTVDCQICFDEMPSSEVIVMDCGHLFCKDCWTEYFIVQIKEGMSKRIRCMAHKCHTICDEEIIRNLVSLKDPNSENKFENKLLESYVEDNNRVKWCPSIPHCGNAISIEGDEVCEVKCACGLEFCFNCSSEAHSPCSCCMWRLWITKCQNDSDTIQWVTQNTRLCPKCMKPVYKDGGCNLVRCVCGQAMCWLCGGPTGLNHTWTSIEGHDCGRYKEEDRKNKNTERARKRFCRYTHYYNHYKAHTESLKLESEELRKKLIDIKLNLEADCDHEKDFSWLLDGSDRLVRARRILSYSYPFAYYMFGDELFTKEMSKREKEKRL